MSNRKTDNQANALQLIDSMQSELSLITQEAGTNYNRLANTFKIAVQQNPDILKCSRESIVREMSKCASDGLVPDTKEAVLLPYGKELNYQPMVYGVIKRMKELGSVFSIVCECVHKEDDFTVDLSDLESLEHKIDIFKKDRGAIVGAYVIFRDEQNRVMARDVMSRSELDKVRKASKSPNSPAWKTWESEMFRKAVLRRGSKYITINNDKIRALVERQDNMFDYSNKPQRERMDPFQGKTIDADIENDGAASSQTPSSAQEDAARTSTDAGGSEGATEPQIFPSEINPKDMPKLDEVLNIIAGYGPPEDGIDPNSRQKIIQVNVQKWKDMVPEYLHPVLGYMINEVVNKCLQRQNRNEDWIDFFVDGLGVITDKTGVKFEGVING